MTTLIREWAGRERAFRLRLGDIVDIEEACGKTGIGAIYMRIASTQFRIMEVYHVVRVALISGGMDPVEAKTLLSDRIETLPLVETAELATSILVAVMSGVPPEPDAPEHDPAVPFDIGAALAAFAKSGLDPSVLRSMRFDDFVAMNRALGRGTVAAPSEEEFEEMLSRLEDEG